MDQERHPLFVNTVRRKAIELPNVGISRYVLTVGRKAILRLLARGSKPHAISTNVFRGRMAKKTSLIQQIQRHVEKKRMQSNLCSSRNFCLHYRMNGNWEAKCWRLQAELHLRNYIAKTRVWRVKIEGNEELRAFSIPRSRNCLRINSSTRSQIHHRSGQLDDAIKGSPRPIFTFNITLEVSLVGD